MKTSPYYNGENSDFEDDVVEIDFEDQFDEKEKVDSAEIGTFGVDPKEEEVYPDEVAVEDVVPEEELAEYSDEEQYTNAIKGIKGDKIQQVDY